MEYILDDKRMPKLNLFYYGRDYSHCGSCWSPSDEEIHMLFTNLTLEDMKLKLKEYLESITRKKYGLTSFDFDSFLKWVAEEAEMFEEEDGTPYLQYHALYFEMEGKTYPPDFDSYYNKMFGIEWDVETSLDPSKVLDSDFWTYCCTRFSEIKKEREEAKKKAQELEDKAWKLVHNYKKEREEYLHLVEMKKKLGGTKKIPLPKKPSFKEYEDSLSTSQKCLMEVMGERHKLGHEIKKIKEDVL